MTKKYITHEEWLNIHYPKKKITLKTITITILILLPIIICGILDANDYKKCDGDYLCLKAHNLH